MNFLLRLPFVKFFLKFRFIRFGMVGAFNAMLDGSVFFSLLYLFGSVHKFLFFETDTWARGIGLLVGVTSAFFLNSRLVFKENGYHNHFYDDITFGEKLTIIGENYIRFVAFYSTGIAMNMLTFKAMKILQLDSFPLEWGLGVFSKLPAYVVSTGVGAVFNYLFCKHFVFKPKVA